MYNILNISCGFLFIDYNNKVVNLMEVYMKGIVVATATGSTGGMWIYYALIAAMFVAMYFFTIRPQNKRE